MPLFPSASDGEGRRGLVRVVNRSADSAEVSIDAFDATDRAYEELRLALEAESSGQFDSSDLEQGNAAKGLTGSTGPGEGDWWLELSSASDIEVLSYVDTASGPLSALRGTAGVETESGMRYEALLWGESGEVRLLNAGGAPAEVRLSGTDDAGSSGGAVELTLAPWSARTLTATALAEGEAGMLGALGAGSGSWRLRLEADREIDVLSLVRGSGGMLSDVSRRGRPAGAPPRTEVIDATARGRPDLWVAASASEAELSPGEAFELTATVGNRGGDASATTLRYHRSADASIAAGDAELGTDAVAELAAGATSAGSLTLNAPTAAGTHYYGACADAVAEETNTANNCSTGVAVTVREPPAQPDLEVRASLSAGAVRPGEAFELLATVRNRGGAQAQATTLRYHRSADASITAGDAEAGTDAVAELAAGATSAESLTVNAPTAAGTYYYGACADAVAEETKTSNNCSAAVLVKVTEPPRRPDLAVAATPSDAALDPGESFSLSATVRNVGDSASAATFLRYYRSTDATISGADTEVGRDAVDALSASGTSAESITLTAPSTAGIYYYGACVEPVDGESDTTNNCSPSIRVDVVEPGVPDLEVGMPLVDDASPEAGGSFTLSATVTNAGDGVARSTTVRYYRSADATIARSDTEVGTDAVNALAASGTSAESITLTAPSTAGIYYYGACVEPVDGESDTTNNCSPSIRVDVVEPGVPDLEVGMPLVDDASPEAGGSFTLSATVTNAGDGVARSTTVRYYRSADATIARSDTEVGTDAVNALAASGTSAESITLTAPSTAGIYYYGACVEPVDGESDTTNNCSPSIRVDVVEPGVPDLEVGMPLVDDASPEAGGSFTLSATVTNAGDGVARSTTARYYRSADATITTSDAEAGTNMVEALAASGRSAESIKLAAPSTAGAYYYGMCVDAVPDESDTTNNCSVAVAVTVRERPPDLTVTMTLSESGLPPGDPFTLTAEVRNVGGADAAATTVRYYRSTDGMIGPSDTELGAAGVPALAAGNAEAGSLELTAPASNGTYHYGACVEPVADESDTTNNCSAVSLTVGRPDLAATISGIGIRYDGGMEVLVTVSNVGTVPAGQTQLTLYGSADATRSRGDFQAPRQPVVAPLEPGAERCYSWGNFLYPNRRDHWYADVGVVRHETSTDNNESAVVEAPHECPTCRHRRCIDF